MRTLRSGFMASAGLFPDREALVVGEERLTYRALEERARSIAATLDRSAPSGERRLTAVLGHRSVAAISGILGSLQRGHGYVPLNPSFPVERTRAMLERSRCRAIVAESAALGVLEPLLAQAREPLAVVVPDLEDARPLRARAPRHAILGARELAPADACELGDAGPDEVAYLLFTSGSTGMPKGVMVAHRNVVAFLDAMTERYAIHERDRFSNTFDLTFDLSVFDLFCAWERGACVVVPTAKEKLFPGPYVRRHGLSVWFSVPSTAVSMSRLKMLEPGAYESLRWALFCGEALPVEIARRFARAAPRAIVENLYGPTELTIACTLHRFTEEGYVDDGLGLVPIGEPYPGMIARVVDEELRELPRGEPGELIMAGPQTAPGYWEDPARTAEAFVRPPGEHRVFYRTGDRVRWPAGGPLVYLGRVDQQIKIQGYRVELGEIEAVMREVSGASAAVAIGWPRNAGGADGIVGFVAAPAADAGALLAAVKARLPSYMQPSAIRLVEGFALNANGKIDRGALLKQLEEEKR